MESFLHSVAQRIWAEHQHDIEHVTVVFNNRRAGLFLRKELETMSDRPFFLPTVIGIDELVSQLGNQQIAPHEFLLFELFDIHRTLEGVERRFETFEEFISFGEMMIADFSEIDLYCVDAAHLFGHIQEHKRLGEWDVSGKPLTSFQEKYINFYGSLHTYYTRLRQNLEAEGKAYTGMAYRNVAEHIDSMIDRVDSSHIYFVGFNALSACERRIIDCCVRRGIGTLVCDGDAYYFGDESQEAGHFLRTNAERFPGIGGFKDHFALADKTIHIINCPENILQAKATGQIVHQLIINPEKKVAAHDTAIVLADEKLLLPVLNSLPGEVESTNVTMGFPYSFSGVNNLATNLLALYCNVRGEKFYHADITDVLSDNLIAKYLGTRDLYARITNAVNQSKIIRATRDDIASMLEGINKADTLLFLFDSATPTADDILTLMRRLFGLLAAEGVFESNTKEKESLACLLQTINYLEELQAQRAYISRIDTLQKIYQRLAQRRSVAFYGEPLQGLQLLGVLETRSLDFTNVIMLSVNEGTLPAGKSGNSLIPLSLKRLYGIPVFEEKDAVYAYNFYRLLQRADEVWLLYSSDAEGMGKGEPSRFILQIKNELAVRHPNIKVVEETVAAINKPTAQGDSRPPAAKDSKALLRLSEIALKGFSPTALNRYRGCPKQFFYSDVLGVRERQEVSEDLEANELGTFIHDTLKDIYLRDSDHIVRAATLENALAEIGAIIDNNFKDSILKGRSNEGKNHLYSEVAKMQISHFLKKEIEVLKKGTRIEISLVEDEMKIPLALGPEPGGATASIEGIADRVDIVDGRLRIADYKSGSVRPDELTVSDAAPDPHEVPDKWFQVMTYAWLYSRKHAYRGPFTAGIFPLRALSSDFMAVSWEGKSELDYSDIERFEEMLRTLLAEILDPAVGFVARPDKTRCGYCPFARICESRADR